MSDTKFYVCEHCGNVAGLINDSGVPMMCCGQKMKKLEAGVVEASKEKHIPVVAVKDNTVIVAVGEVEHPMTAEHNISWVYLQTNRGGQRKCLEVGRPPVATFALSGEKPIAVYAYCNLHGLWKADVEEKGEQVCDLKPVDTKTAENYTVCRCNNVSYFDILDALDSTEKMEHLLDAFNSVKNTTKCSTGCGGCYDKVLEIISSKLS